MPKKEILQEITYQPIPPEEQSDWTIDALVLPETAPIRHIGVILGNPFNKTRKDISPSISQPRQVVIALELNEGSGEVAHRPYSPNRGHRPKNELPCKPLVIYKRVSSEAVTGRPNLETARKRGASLPAYKLEQGDLNAKIPKPRNSFNCWPLKGKIK